LFGRIILVFKPGGGLLNVLKLPADVTDGLDKFIWGLFVPTVLLK
jgi:hypothetical protein